MDARPADDLWLAKWSARLINAAGLAISCWVALDPKRSGAAVLATALVPLAALALVARFRGMICIATPKGDPRPFVAMALFFPSCLLGLLALEVPVIDPLPLFLIGVPIGLVPAVIAAWLDPTVQRRWLAALVFGAVNAGYGVGGTSQVNRLLDSSEPVMYRAEVLDKRIRKGKHPEYDLELAAWGPVKEPAEVKVRRRLFDQVAAHDLVDVALHEGALGVRWFQIRVEPPGRR